MVGTMQQRPRNGPVSRELENKVFTPLAGSGGVWAYAGGGRRVLWVDAEGNFHREDGPAVDLGIVTSWYRHGLRHRVGGPAHQDAARPEENEWFVDGVQQAPDLAWFAARGLPAPRHPLLL